MSWAWKRSTRASTSCTQANPSAASWYSEPVRAPGGASPPGPRRRTSIFRHVAVGTDDPEHARRSYDPVLSALGIAAAETDGRGRLIYRQDGGILIVGRPINGGSATYANGGTLGFRAPSAEAVFAWHAAGLANGGTACEGPPETRVSPATGKTVCVAYLRDPAGNKLCAAFDAPD